MYIRVNFDDTLTPNRSSSGAIFLCISANLLPRILRPLVLPNTIAPMNFSDYLRQEAEPIFQSIPNRQLTDSKHLLS